VNETYEIYNPTDYLNSPEDVAEYINTAMEDGDPNLMLAVLGDAARATRNMTELAKEAGVARDTLYTALKEDGNIQFTNLLAILNSMGLKLEVKAKAA